MFLLIFLTNNLDILNDLFDSIRVNIISCDIIHAIESYLSFKIHAGHIIFGGMNRFLEFAILDDFIQKIDLKLFMTF